jgi:YbgC/YbaW family acyl-CoA thioester hydrolase
MDFCIFLVPHYPFSLSHFRDVFVTIRSSYPVSAKPPIIETEEEVMFYDTDIGGVVHNIAYLRFIEKARTKLATQLGMELREMAGTGMYPVVVRTEIDYKTPATLGDVLTVRGTVDFFQRARFWVQFEVLRPMDGAVCVACRQCLAIVQMPDGKVQRLPEMWLGQYPDAFQNKR